MTGERLAQRLAILLELLRKHKELIPTLLPILFFRHPVFSFSTDLFTGFLFRSIDLWLQSRLLFQRTTDQAFLHTLQREAVIIEPRFLCPGNESISTETPPFQ